RFVLSDAASPRVNGSQLSASGISSGYIRDKLSARPQSKNGRIFSYRLPAPIPLTRCRSSALLNGRASMMRSAMDGPIPGTFSSSVCDAVLTSSLVGAGKPEGVVSSEGNGVVPSLAVGVAAAFTGVSPTG